MYWVAIASVCVRIYFRRIEKTDDEIPKFISNAQMKSNMTDLSA